MTIQWDHVCGCGFNRANEDGMSSEPGDNVRVLLPEMGARE